MVVFIKNNIRLMKHHLISFLLIGLLVANSIYGHEGHDSDHSSESEIPNIVLDPQQGPNPWTNLILNNDPANFQFAVVTDRTGDARPGVFADAVVKLNLLQPEFVMSVGDLIQGYTTDKDQLEYEWNEFDGLVQQLEMPFFYVAGNHDYTNEVMAKVWKERYGASYYHFVYRDVLFIMLNSNSANKPHHMTQDQVDWLKGVLQANPDPRWTLVFVHAPLWDRPDGEQNLWPEIDELLQGRKYTVFAGHEHRYTKQVRKNRNYYTLATTGGVSALRGERFGEFDHVVWVTMTDEGPLLANLLLKGIWDDNIRTEAIRSKQDQWIESGNLNLQPILYEDAFQSGTTELRLTNDSDIPYDLDIEFKLLTNVTLDSQFSFHITVDPNEVETIPVTVSAPETLRQDTTLAEMDWKMNFSLQEEKVSYAGSQKLVAMAKFPISRMDTIKVDGSLNEWGELPFSSNPDITTYQVENCSSEEDSSFKWGIGYDGAYLYVAIHALDDELSVDPGDAYWVQDCINLAIDARPERVRNSNTWLGGQGDAFVFVSLSPSEADSKGINQYPQGLPEGSLYAVRKHEAGYDVEIAIPFEALNKMATSDWTACRINVGQTDRDTGEKGVCLQLWKPLWSDPGSIPGSGSFYLQTK